MLTHTNYSHLFAALISVFLIAFFAAASDSAHAQQDDADTIKAAAIHPQLAQQLSVAEGPVSFLIILDEQVDVAGESAQSGLINAASRTDQRRAIYERLTQQARTSQAPLRAWLDEQGVAYRPFYIVNMIEVLGDEALAQALRRRPEVDRLAPNPAVESQLAAPALPAWLTPLDLTLGTALDVAAPQSTLALPYGLTYTNADDLWALGYTGQGIVIGDQDTGVQWDHNALKANYRGWDTATGTADHVYNWFDAWGAAGRPAYCSTDPQVPCDDHGHGTHTVGTLMGDGTADGYTRIGMAPDASWIGCRNMKNGVGTPSSYMACFEFFLAPYPQGGDPFTQGRPDLSPHIISNSWSCTISEGCDQDSLRATVEVVRAAGQFVVAAAGNEGSACSTVMSPIATHDAVFSIGAHDSSGTIASFSSRGPVTSDGSGRLKPDLSAPGVGVFSARAPDAYSTSSGTSMATPHVASAAALLWSAAPSLIGDIDLTEQVLIKSAVPVPVSQCSGGSDAVSPNNVYGHGRLDVLAAVEMALAPGSLEVTLLDHLGQSLAAQTVTLIDQHTGYAVSAQTDPSGMVLLPSVYAGNYRLIIDAGAAYFPDTDVTLDPDQDLQLTLASPGAYDLELTPAAPGISTGVTVEIVARVRPAKSGVPINFVAHAGIGPNSAVTDETGQAQVTFAAGGSPAVEQIEAAIGSSDVTDTARIYVGAATASVVQDRATAGSYSIGDLSTYNVTATKLGQGMPWLGVARFTGDPCAQSAVGVDEIGDFVDVLMEDLSAIDSLEVTVGYTEVGDNPALYWCDADGQWSQIVGGTVDTENKTVKLTVGESTTPDLGDLEGTPLVVGSSTPLSITVAWFLAERVGDVVSFRWQTANETGVAGFDLVAESDDGTLVTLNGELIPSQAIDSIRPTDYAFNAAAEATRFYLNELGIDGDVVEHGPFVLGREYGAIGAPTGGEFTTRVWLPMVTRE